MEPITGFEQPMEVSDVEMAFPALVSHLMPAHHDLKQWARTDGAKPYLTFQRVWFCFGLGEQSEVYLKNGIDGRKAFRHLKTIQGSYEPKHEHKEAGVAWLLQQWSSAPPMAVPANKEK